MSTPSVEARNRLRAVLAEADEVALRDTLDSIRRGPSSWGCGRLEVEIICELKIREANAKLEDTHV